MKINTTMAFNEGYISGYNQARVDSGIISQADADKVIGNPEIPSEKRPKWAPGTNAKLCELERKHVLYRILKYPLKEMVNAYVQRGGIITLPREADCIGIVWTLEEEEAEKRIDNEVLQTFVGVLTESEKRAAIRGYEANLSFHNIAKIMLVQRNVGLMREMTREIGRVCSKAFKRQMYPIEFYGKCKDE